MKYADCNARQKKAFRNILHASNWLLGGLENTMLDNPEDSEEYQSAKAQLAITTVWLPSFTAWPPPRFTTKEAAASATPQRATSKTSGSAEKTG